MLRVILASLILTLPCGAGSFPDYPVRPLSDYPISAEKAGLTIAAYPLDAIKEQQTYFSIKLTPKGYLPVFVVMQNGSNEGSFLFKKDAITYRLLSAARSIASTPGARSRTGETVMAGQAVSDVGGAALAVETGAVPFDPLFGQADLFGRMLISNATQVQQNLLKKALQSRTLSPGASARGFLYVPMPKGSSRQTIHLRIPVTRPGSDEPLDFDLVF